MLIEVWSDVLCPFCYIGKRHLDAALAECDAAARVRVVWKSFQLDPGADRLPRRSNAERLARKYGRSVEWARRLQTGIAGRAAAVGLHVDLDRVVPTNSFDALRLLHLAAAADRQDAASERLFAAHFTEGLDVGDRSVLQTLGGEIGLDAGQVAAVLDGEAYGADVRREAEEARRLGVTGVPFFRLAETTTVAGAQPVGILVGAIRSALA